MDFDLLYPNRFLKSAQFAGRDVTLTIKQVDREELEDDKGKKTKGIVSFVERPFQLVLNKTNGLCLKAMFGRETNDWVGKRVTFYPEAFYNNETKEHTTCIRVRGSPDLKADTSFVLKLSRKKPVTWPLKKTGQARAASPSAPSAPAPASEPSAAISDEEKASILAQEREQAERSA